MIVRVLLQAIATYLLVVLAVYLGQRGLQYHPETRKPASPASAGLPGMREVTAATADGLDLLAWFMPPKEKDGRIIVMFHGNAGTIADRAVKARHFISKGYGVYMAEYRGYGGNHGSPSEEGFYNDARAGLKWLEKEGYSPGQFVIYGESIGSGPAVQMASEMQPRELVLEAPFSSAADVAKTRYFWLPVDLLLKDRYDNILKIPSVKSSLLIVHGDEDGVVPIELSRKLFDAAQHPKEYVTINGGAHNDLYDHHAGHIVTDWLEKQP